MKPTSISWSNPLPTAPYSLRELTQCRHCPRLVEWREAVARKPAKGFTAADYWSKPVPGFGDPQARLLVLGLAPGAQGANRSGRPFTGDAAGTWLYPALFAFGFSNQPQSTHREDGLLLRDAYITNLVKCVPPANKPLPAEIAMCAPYLALEFQDFTSLRVILTLGNLAWQAYWKWAYHQGLTDRPLPHRFAHGAMVEGPHEHTIIASYHCSRQNTNTGRLTRPMFDEVFAQARHCLDE